MVCFMVSKDLHSAIIYSHAFADDNDDVYIATDTAMAAEIIKSEKETVMSFLERDRWYREKSAGGVVLVANDL